MWRVDRLLEETQNPRHRFLFQAHHRHRFLEIAGRYDEIFAPEMMVETPVYHFQVGGIDAKLDGQDVVKSLYRTWAETNQSIFYVENEQVAVADNFIASVVTAHQQVWGRTIWLNKALSVLPSFISDRVLKKMLAARRWHADENAMYLYTTTVEMIWPHDDRGRLVGEDVWEPDPDRARLTNLDPKDVLTTKRAAEILTPLIKPLPSFDEAVLGRRVA